MNKIFRNKKGQFAPGFHHSIEWRQMMSKLMKGNKFALGYKHTEEAKKKMSKANKGRKVSKETRRKISFKLLRI